jgi:NAD(P)-dependent dehydrogenase (short-subunit alcohol dehydrogenase family)
LLDILPYSFAGSIPPGSAAARLKGETVRGLTGKRVLVGGSATGIGAATARRLAEEGVRVFLADVRAGAAAAVADKLAAEGASTTSGFYDLHDEASIQAVIVAAVGTFGGLDGVVNVAYEGRPEFHGRDFELLEMDSAVWQTVLHANVIGTALMMKHAIPHLIEAGGGSIVNISSGASHAGEGIRVVYGASKAGINSVTRHVANKYGDRGVRCNAVSPGAILTEAGEAAFSQEMRAAMIAHMPVKRLGKPEDIAATIAYLLSDDAEWVTGQVWSHNGGGGLRE